MNALELRGLTKHYKDFTLGPLDLTLPGGTICGLIGENGAGKSTTIRLILDMVQRDGGTMSKISRMVVLLPAPFSPIRPQMVPPGRVRSSGPRVKSL